MYVRMHWYMYTVYWVMFERQNFQKSYIGDFENNIFKMKKGIYVAGCHYSFENVF